MHSRLISRGLILFSFLGLAFGVYGWWSTAHSAQAEPAPAQPPIIQSSGTLPDFSAIVRAFGPAVVNITTTSEASIADSSESEPDPSDPLYEFFRRFGIPIPRDEGLHMGLGSGFIINQDGIILTNAHVVADASEVTVKLTDKREFRAKVIGIDKPSDVAVLQIKASNLPTVRIGDTNKINVGEWVLAIGSPFGFENSVTAGIVSAKSRRLPDENYVPFIQTDVAVNPGNSGGPLFNMRGEVVGINSQIYSRSGGYQGLSFAIPIDVAMNVESQLTTRGKVVRGRIGALIQDLNQGLADSFGLKSADGALVSSIEPGSPAEKAGLQPGDVVLSLNGTHISSSSELPPKVADLKPGSDAEIEIWRNHHREKLHIKIGELHDKMQVTEAEQNGSNHLGLAVRPLTADEKRQLHADAGLMVENSTGPSARAGIRPGDIILAANGTPLRDVEQLRLMTKKPDHYVALLIQRDDNKIFVAVKPG